MASLTRFNGENFQLRGQKSINFACDFWGTLEELIAKEINFFNIFRSN